MVRTPLPVAPVFLSASAPDPQRNPTYFASANLINIRDAVCSLAEIVVGEGQLVFGGHPAISPMIGQIAQRLGSLGAVSIYQSEHFRAIVPPASLAWGTRIQWTPSAAAGREASLEAMRLEMLGAGSQPRRYRAGFFIGGMEGVEREFELFRLHQPQAAFWPLASTGGAARMLFDQHRATVFGQPAATRAPANLDELLDGELNYRKVVRTLLAVS